MLNQTENTTSNNQTPIPSVRKEMPKKSKLPMYFGLFIILVVAFAGIGISLRQFFIRESVAPTAPTESQANIDKIQSCSLSFDVAPPQSNINCIKEAYRDELSNTPGDYDLVQTREQFSPGDVVVYDFVVRNDGEQTATITASDTLQVDFGDNVIFDYEFLDSNCDGDEIQNDTLTCVAKDLAPGEEKSFTFRIKLSELIDTNISLTNMVSITDGLIDNSCSVEIDINPETQSYCNESCSENSDCIEANHACVNNLCRLVSNPESETCNDLANCNESCSENRDCVEDNHSCYDGFCRLSENPESITCEPEVKAYCGEYCSTNSDCLQTDHLCYNNECRLASNPTNAECKLPVEEPTPTPQTKAYCGEYCSTNSDCMQGDHICYFNECRLAEYPDRQDCSFPPVVTTTYIEPTPIVNCNQDCLINRDCTNGDHICYEGSCRLAEYPASTTCTVPQTPESFDQPKMPEELPQSGSDELINWIKAGIGILGAGALLLLL